MFARRCAALSCAETFDAAVRHDADGVRTKTPRVRDAALRDDAGGVVPQECVSLRHDADAFGAAVPVDFAARPCDADGAIVIPRGDVVLLLSRAPAVRRGFASAPLRCVLLSYEMLFPQPYIKYINRSLLIILLDFRVSPLCAPERS